LNVTKHARATIRRWSAAGPAAGQSYDGWRLSGPHDDEDDEPCDCGCSLSECTCALADDDDWNRPEHWEHDAARFAAMARECGE
jgi:hypothetical protein